MGILTFRREGCDDAAQIEIIDRVRLDGHAMLTSTVVGGRAALRFCTINPRTTLADIESSVARLIALGE